jgi:hypothetical protein
MQNASGRDHKFLQPLLWIMGKIHLCGQEEGSSVPFGLFYCKVLLTLVRALVRKYYIINAFMTRMLYNTVFKNYNAKQDLLSSTH